MAESDSPYHLKLHTKEQREALARLRPTSELPLEQFHRFILLQLQNISRAAIYKSRKSGIHLPRPFSAVARARVHNLKRMANLVQRMADQLAEGVRKLQGSDLTLKSVLPQPPVEELRSYADALKSQAENDQRYVFLLTPRHRTHRETQEIIALVRFVEEQTGNPHWRRAAILVGAALGNETFGEDRLRKLVKYHEK